MNSHEKERKEQFRKPQIDKKNGLSIGYDKKEFKKFFPSLSKEIAVDEKSLKMEDIDFEVEGDKTEEKEEGTKEESQKSKGNAKSDELVNPGVTAFLRRCKKKEEAIEILEYLLKREEISQTQYDKIRKRISKEGGLKQYIEECGGFKRPGYYIRKFYKKTNDRKVSEK
ncbi:MAG: DUF2095 family protein [Promethearchaeia archaeon]